MCIKQPGKNNLKSMRDEEGNMVTVEYKIMNIWKRYFQTISRDGSVRRNETIVEKTMGRHSSKKM